MLKTILNKNYLTFKVLPIVLGIILIKLIVHLLGWEILSLNSLFSGIVAANVFLMGFLITGVLTDYKESEKLPGDIASCINAIADEMIIIKKRKNHVLADQGLKYLSDLTENIKLWFYKKTSSAVLMEKIEGLNNYFADFEDLTQANFIVRMKQEQNTLRRIITRIHMIRETSFIASGYTIAEITTSLLSLGLILAKIDPFYESLFFVFVITFLLIYMLLLIKDLDNPFSYYEMESMESISLKPLDELKKILENKFN